MKHNFKDGDKVICIPGFINGERGKEEYGAGGCGYEENKIFIIKSISNYDQGGPGDCLWPTNGDSGIYARAVKLYIEEPIYEVY